MSTLLLIVGVLFVLSLIPFAVLGARTYLKYRGTRAVTCPATGGPAAVEVDITHATMTAATDEAELRVRSCSGWPESRECGQQCLAEIAAAPAECMVRTTLVEWYEGSTCALCGRNIGEVHWVEHKPALLTPGRETIEWSEVSAEHLPRVLATHQRVCWNCHVSNALRERLPGLVIEPEPRTGRS